MDRKVVFLLTAALAGGAAWACASAGVSLSSTSYRAQDLAEADYESMYEFLEAHTKVRIGESGAQQPLAVRISRGRGRVGGAANPGAGGAPTSGDTVNPGAPGGGFGGGGGAQARGAAKTASGFVPALLYIDDSETGVPIPRLRQIAPEQVESLRILDRDEASSRYGGSGRVAIVSITLKGPGR